MVGRGSQGDPLQSENQRRGRDLLLHTTTPIWRTGPLTLFTQDYLRTGTAEQGLVHTRGVCLGVREGGAKGRVVPISPEVRSREENVYSFISLTLLLEG